MTHRVARIEVADRLRGYRLHSMLDLKEDRRAATTIQAAFALTVVAMVLAAWVLELPLDSTLNVGVTTALTVGACLAYMALHELTHALALWVLTRERPTVAVRLPYLVTGSEALLTRGTAVIVALTPVVLHTSALLGLLATLPSDYFLTTYVVLGLNLAGSAGDVLQARAFLRLPSAALIRDDGQTTSVFLPTQGRGDAGGARTSENECPSRQETVITGRTSRNTADLGVGVGVSLGAGLGMVFGLLLGGGAGLAIGVGLGAGLGVVAGAVWDRMT